MAIKHLWPVAMLLLAGCFPLELDVNSKGEVLIYRGEGFLIYDPASGKATPIAGPGKGAPAFARFAPDGEHILTVVKEYGFRFDLVPIKGGPGRKLFEADNTTYTLFSPDGTQLAVTRLADKKKFKDAPQAVPELHLIDVGSGGKTLAVSEVGACFRWFADSKRLLLCKVTDVDANGRYTAQLEEYDIAARTSKPLAALIGDARMIIDLTADNSRVIFTAFVVGKPGEKLTLDPAENAGHLFELTRADLSVVKLKEATDFARYSPSGKKILLHTTEGLLVADLTEKHFTTVVEQAANLSSSTLALPGWIDEDRFFFFQERPTYGTTVKGLAMVTIKSDGSGMQVVQPLLDRAAIEAERKYNAEVRPDDPKTPVGKADANPVPIGAGSEPSPEQWDFTMTLTAGGFAVALLACGLFLLVMNRRRPSADAPHSSQVVLRCLAMFFALGGCAGAAFLAVSWHKQVNDPMVKQARDGLPLMKLLGMTEDKEAKVRAELAELEKRGKVLYFLYGAIALGLVGGLLSLLRIQPAFGAVLMLTAVAAPAVFIPGTAIFTAPFLLGAAVASRLKPAPARSCSS